MLIEVLLVFNQAFAADKVKVKTQDVIPITMANLRGHRNLYSEGWFFVTSSEQAFAYAKANGIESAGRALLRLKESTLELKNEKNQRLAFSKEESKQESAQDREQGKERQKKIQQSTNEIADELNQKANLNAQQSWQTFVQGNISLVKRTAEDREELKNLPGNYFSKLKSDFSDLRSEVAALTASKSSTMSEMWSDGFQKAAEEFDKEYVESGTKGNSLSALGNISWGYLKTIYYGIFKPSGGSVVSSVETGASYVAQTAIFAGGGSLSFVGRTVETAGLSVYYSAQTGYKIISPTIESGLLISLASVQKISSPLAKLGGGTIGLINQVAVNAVQPATQFSKDSAVSIYENARYSGLVTYNLLTATGEVAVAEVKSGVVLGYNALTALPTHLVLGTANTVFFLAWDGPRLVIAKASGELDSGSLPVGTVVDLERLKESPNTKVEVIIESPEEIKKVLKELPRDL